MTHSGWASSFLSTAFLRFSSASNARCRSSWSWISWRRARTSAIMASRSFISVSTSRLSSASAASDWVCSLDGGGRKNDGSASLALFSICASRSSVCRLSASTLASSSPRIVSMFGLPSAPSRCFAFFSPSRLSSSMDSFFCGGVDVTAALDGA